MVDESWIRELEVRVRPLRVELPPWGEVLAREAVRAPSREKVSASRNKWFVAAAVAMAAGVVVMTWPRHEEVRADSTLVVDAPDDAPAVSGAEVDAPPKEVVPATAPPVATPAARVEPPSPAFSEETPVATPLDEDRRAKVPRARPKPRRTVSRTPSPSPSPSSDPIADCVLDPSRCGQGKAPARDDVSPDEGDGEALPESLTASDIKAGIDQIKPYVVDCARAHNGRSGDRVKIKLTIVGDTGMVSSASILPPELPVALDACIVAAARRATFPRFAKASMGAVFPITLP